MAETKIKCDQCKEKHTVNTGDCSEMDIHGWMVWCVKMPCGYIHELSAREAYELALPR